MNHPRVCVVVSYWTGHQRKILERLLGQMLKFDAGMPFDLVVVCNGGDRQPLMLSDRFNSLEPKVINRINAGFNQGAWHAGWLASPNYHYYLFLQDECFIKQSGWVSEFVFRMENDLGIGLLGESTMWVNMTWKYIRTATDRDLGPDWFDDEVTHPLDFYQEYLVTRHIPLTEVGEHIQTVIIFSSNQVLTEIGGLPFGTTYREGVACEIGLSTLVRSKGYRISKVKDDKYVLLGHSQWTRFDQIKRGLRSRLANFVKSVFPWLKR